MTARFHPQLVNDAFGDPGVHIEFMFEKRAMLFDLGDVSGLSSRKLLRVSDVFISHMHLDHFYGFDRLLRLSLGREHTLRLFGPEGLIDAVSHKLGGYTWNLVDNYAASLTLIVSELVGEGTLRTVEFPCRDHFHAKQEHVQRIEDGRLFAEESYSVRTVVLDHGIPCLAFALEEQAHVNVWKNRIEGLGLEVGQWLGDLKQAIARGEPDDAMITVSREANGRTVERALPLGELRGAAHVTPGQKIAYVADSAPTDANLEKIAALAADATILFIESPFLHEDLDLARDRNHLTARLAGTVAREAGVQRLVTFHYSSRYEERGEELANEAQTAFEG